MNIAEDIHYSASNYARYQSDCPDDCCKYHYNCEDCADDYDCYGTCVWDEDNSKMC